MRKMTTNKFLAATSLALTVAAFGCSTNRYPGNGEPTITSPGYGAANQAVTPGSSSGTEVVNPPMASSYNDALADAVAQQGYEHQARLLGPANPGGVQVGVPLQPTGGAVVPPAMLVNPQSTINASVSSPNGDQGITGGVAGGGGGVVFTGGATVAGGAVSAGSVATGSTAAASPLAVTGALGVGATPASGTVVPATTATTPTVTSTSARAISGVVTGTTPVATGATTTASTMAVTNSINVGATPASGTVVPSAASTSPSVSGGAVFAPMVSNGVVNGTTAVTTGLPASALRTTSGTARTTASATTTSSASRTIGVTSGLRISQGANGQIVVSNASTAVPSTKASTASVSSTKASTSTNSVKP